MAMNRLGKLLGFSATFGLLATGVAGCLTRPVGKQTPTTKESFIATVSQQAVDKVDLLFVIDNSSSMGDKQTILAEAVPNLIQGLLKPKCVDPNGVPQGGALADPNGSKDNNYNCPAGTQPEFSPVTDMHIGIVSSSLGGMGGDVCGDTNTAERRQNDAGHLIARGASGDVAAAAPSNFLAWFPDNKDNQDAKRHPPPATPTKTIDALNAAFGDMVVGVGQDGCGLEAQLESMYRFLIQPDPWVSVKKDGDGKADLGSVADNLDLALLQQRADFLRPDSLVSIIMLTDEDDSSADPLSVGGSGWAFMANGFPGSSVPRPNSVQGASTAPRATSACTDPNRGPGHADCTSCAFTQLPVVQNDPNCKAEGIPGNPATAGYYGPTDDSLNVRFFRMKERFGVDPQFPIQRYVDGLSRFQVPDREAEHVVKVEGGKRSIAGYTHTPKCTNPLFAKELPRAAGDELCKLPRSTRSPDLVFFAVVGGVPNNLLHFTPGDPEKSRITSEDWVKILGRRPEAYDYTGIDPHMIQSVTPRPGLPGSAAHGDNGSDPVHGREWDTLKNDLQYACTFDLPKPTDCASLPNEVYCDCRDETTAAPLCDSATTQLKAKAYPTIREFMVARALGEQGIAASLCPIQLSDNTKEDYGYNPAVAAIIDRLKNALTTQCLPQKLTRDEGTQQVPCLVLAQLAEPTESCGQYGLQEPPADILKVFREQQKAESGNVAAGGLDLSALPVCVVPQEVVGAGADCKASTNIGWCYVENAGTQKPAGRCSQALLFSAGSAALQGARFSLQCIQQFAEGEAAGDPQAANP